MIITPKKQRWSKSTPPIKFAIVGGRYVCRCGDTIAVSPRLIGDYKYEDFDYAEGYYSVSEIDNLPDELKFDFELGL